MAEYTYTVEKPCPVCGEKTHVTKLKARLITLSTDEDFCVHYQGVNPYRYRVWLCEHCGFAADEKQFADEPLSARDKAKIQELLEGRTINLPYHEERTVEVSVGRSKSRRGTAWAWRGSTAIRRSGTRRMRCCAVPLSSMRSR